jgi:hypothetical protein
MRQHRGFASFSDKPSEDRVRYLSTGRTLRFKKHPRYGTWSLAIDAGQLPEGLRGVYLSFGDALRAAESIYSIKDVTVEMTPQEVYSSSVNDVREEMGLERK